MTCPHCNKKVEIVRVYCEAWQYADVKEKGEITEYHSVEEVTDDTHAIECKKCGYDFLEKGEIKP